MPCLGKQVEANRHFNCASCRAFVVICSSCDRGNRYCTSCAPSVRAQRVRESSRRYQSTPRGKMMHALRQQRYRQRQKLQKVTHHPSKVLYERVLLARAGKSVTSNPTNSGDFMTSSHKCRFCGTSSTRFLRRHHLQDRCYQGKTRPFRLAPNSRTVATNKTSSHNF